MLVGGASPGRRGHDAIPLLRGEPLEQNGRQRLLEVQRAASTRSKQLVAHIENFTPRRRSSASPRRGCEFKGRVRRSREPLAVLSQRLFATTDPTGDAGRGRGVCPPYAGFQMFV